MNCSCCFAGSKDGNLCAPCEAFHRLQDAYLAALEKHYTLHEEFWFRIKKKRPIRTLKKLRKHY